MTNTQALKITTNNHWRELLSWHELPEDQRAEFDYLSEDEQFNYRFVKYRGDWIDAIDTQVIGSHPFGYPARLELAGWHSIATDSFFSGLVFRFDADYEHVVVGLALA